MSYFCPPKKAKVLIYHQLLSELTQASVLLGGGF